MVEFFGRIAQKVTEGTQSAYQKVSNVFMSRLGLQMPQLDLDIGGDVDSDLDSFTELCGEQCSECVPF